jgi:RNA polymerase sigma-70 factor (ECF subfamily)
MNDQPMRDYVARALEVHEGPLLRYANSLCRDMELARDAVQDTFIRLWQAEEKGLPDRLAPWLYKVCRNRVFEIMRKERRMQPTDPHELTLAGQAPSPERVVVEGEMERALAALVGKLPPREQELIRLKFQNDLSYQEMSGVTGLSVSNVGFILHNVLKTLRRQAALAHGN